MDDKELADAALKILDGYVLTTTRLQYVFSEEIEPLLDDKFVRDPRVAMALLNKVYDAYASLDGVNFTSIESPLERPIVEQCVEILS